MESTGEVERIVRQVEKYIENKDTDLLSSVLYFGAVIL